MFKEQALTYKRNLQFPEDSVNCLGATHLKLDFLMVFLKRLGKSATRRCKLVWEWSYQFQWLKDRVTENTIIHPTIEFTGIQCPFVFGLLEILSDEIMSIYTTSSTLTATEFISSWD